jgi:hypothetical protein
MFLDSWWSAEGEVSLLEDLYTDFVRFRRGHFDILDG